MGSILSDHVLIFKVLSPLFLVSLLALLLFLNTTGFARKWVSFPPFKLQISQMPHLDGTAQAVLSENSMPINRRSFVVRII